MKISVSPETRAEKILLKLFRIAALSLFIMLFVAFVYDGDVFDSYVFLGTLGWSVICVVLSLLAFVVAHNINPTD